MHPAVPREPGRAARSISGASATSWSTSIRTPTSRSICGCGCWRSGRARTLSCARRPARCRKMQDALQAAAMTEQSAPKNICCVGDDDQSIYGWRGAEVDNILRFEHDFPGAKVIRLERNYRSTGHILAAASHLIAHNEGRLGKTLRTEDVPGEKVTVTGAWDSEEEARAIGEEIEQLQRQQPHARRDRDPGARLVPDARVRRPLRHARPALSRDRRPALLRARRNPRRARLSARHQLSRPTTSPSSASSTCPSAASATPPSSCCTTTRASAASR